MSISPSDEYFCTSCGDFVDQLDSDTGWCLECSGISLSICYGCGVYFEKDTPHRKLCKSCREERWLTNHADELELYLSYGARMEFAKREVYHNNRPHCMSCGDSIAKEGANFCNKKIACKRWARRYRRLRERYQARGIIDPKRIALSEVSAEIFATKHKMEIIQDGPI